MKLIFALPAVALLILLAGCHPQSVNSKVNSALLTRFAHEHFPGYEVKASSMTERDTDNDGYVSGTITIQKPGETSFRVIGVDVPINGEAEGEGVGSGCRLSREQLHDDRF